MKSSLPRSIVRWTALEAALLLALVALGCSGANGAVDPDAASAGAAEEEGPVLVGVTTRQAIEEAVPGWPEATAEADLFEEDAGALAGVPPGADVTVFLGTWCSDSRREVPRFWRALDQAQRSGRSLPFEVEYVAVDREKEEPAERIGPAGVEYVPTFIVRRDGQEVGRIVESSPGGIERDLLALLEGYAYGVLSGRDDL